jgi:hypothetical protein
MTLEEAYNLGYDDPYNALPAADFTEEQLAEFNRGISDRIWKDDHAEFDRSDAADADD